MSTFYTGNPADVIQRQNASDRRSGIDQRRVDDYGAFSGGRGAAETRAVDDFSGIKTAQMKASTRNAKARAAAADSHKRTAASNSVR